MTTPIAIYSYTLTPHVPWSNLSFGRGLTMEIILFNVYCNGFAFLIHIGYINTSSSDLQPTCQSNTILLWQWNKSFGRRGNWKMWRQCMYHSKVPTTKVAMRCYRACLESIVHIYVFMNVGYLHARDMHSRFGSLNDVPLAGFIVHGTLCPWANTNLLRCLCVVHYKEEVDHVERRHDDQSNAKPQPAACKHTWLDHAEILKGARSRHRQMPAW